MPVMSGPYLPLRYGWHRRCASYGSSYRVRDNQWEPADDETQNTYEIERAQQRRAHDRLTQLRKGTWR